MAFVRVEKSRQGGSSFVIPCVTMGTYLADGKKHTAKHVAFRISAALIDQLGWTFTDRRIDVTINEGIDKDSGFLQMVPTPADLHTRRMSLAPDGQGKHGIALSMTADGFKHYVLNECPVSADVTPHIIEGNTLIIECPDWLRFNPQSVPQPEPEPEKKPTPVTQLHRRGRRT